jgi:short-subunit dehydrogenase
MTAFKDQVSVITGASSGIGRAIALGLAAQGSALCLIGRRIETLEAVAEAARALAASVCCYCADLSLDEQVRALVVKLSEVGRIGVLIHSAGTMALGPIESAAIEDLDRQYRINVRAPYLLTQALLPALKRGRGQIVFINSSATLYARANVGQYAATKAALKAIADSLRDEVNADGVRVLSVYPGRTASPMQAALHALEGKVYEPERLMQPGDVAAMVINALSLPRSAEVTEIYIRPMLKSS